MPVVGEEMVRQERNVLLALPERRQGDRHHPKPVEQIAPQDPALDRLLRIPVGRGDEPDIDLGVGRLGPDPADHAVLDHPEQLGLEGERHFGQLVQKQGAPVGGFQEPGLVAIGPGEGALAMTEHLGLEQGLGKRGAVDRHHELLRPPAMLVNELGEDFLSGSAFAADEHAGVGGSHLPRQLNRFAKQGRDPDQGERPAGGVLLGDLLAKLARLPVHHDRVGSPSDEDLEVGRRKGLGEIIPGAGPKRLDARADARVPGHHHDDHVGIGFERGAQQIEAGDLRHVQIDQHDVELALLEKLARFFTPSRQGHREPVHLKDAGATLPKGAFVINQQDPDPGLDLGGDGERITRGLCASRVRFSWSDPAPWRIPIRLQSVPAGCERDGNQLPQS